MDKIFSAKECGDILGLNVRSKFYISKVYDNHDKRTINDWIDQFKLDQLIDRDYSKTK